MSLSSFSTRPLPDGSVALLDYGIRAAVRLTGRPAENAARWLAQGWTPDLTDRSRWDADTHPLDWADALAA